MSIIDHLASAQGRRDDQPNADLARELASRSDRDGIRELVDHLNDRDRAIQSDCIKTLYEVGAINPVLIAEHAETFVRLLKHKNNRLVWGAMSALATIATVQGEQLVRHLDTIETAIRSGSVITVDRGIRTLATLARQETDCRERILAFLFDHLKTCRPKDVPQHAETVSAAVKPETRQAFIDLLQQRLGLMNASRKKRIETIISTL